MQLIMDKISFINQELLKRACDVKHGKVSIDLHIHNGRITTITNTITISVKEYLNEDLGLPNTALYSGQNEGKNEN